MHRTTHPLVLALAALTLALALHAAAPSAAAAQDKGRVVSNLKGVTIDGDKVKLSDYKGKVVVVSLWATWCKPCIEELKHLQALHAKYADKGLVILAISTDDARDKSKIKRVARSNRLEMTILHDASGSISAAINPRGTVPFSMFVNRDGTADSTHEGFTSGDEVKYEKLIKTLIAKQ